VEVITEIVQRDAGTKAILAGRKGQKKHRASLKYTKTKGLRGKKTGGSSFVVDIPNIFRKAKGKLQWSIENEDEHINGKSCVVVVGTFEDNLLMRLYIRKEDHVVLRYDQYLNGKQIGSITLKYSRNSLGDLVQTNVSTEMFLVKQKMIQEYSYLPEDQIEASKKTSEATTVATKAQPISSPNIMAAAVNENEAISFTASYGMSGINLDTGYIGANEWYGRMEMRMNGGFGGLLADAELPGSAWFNGSAVGVTGSTNQGTLAYDFGFDYGVHAYLGIPAFGLDFEIDVLSFVGVSSVDFRFQGSETFTPFLLDSSVSVFDTIGAQNVLDVDITSVIPVPFVGAGVSLAVDGGLEETLSGDHIYFSNPGSNLYSETSSLSFTGGSSTLTYYENASAEVTLGFWPGLY
ncbi:hypothetical protein LCGC14_2816350, partial [marine sediment metagenome]